MIIDHLGLPKDTGASDLQDSSRLAGIMAVFNHPLAPDCSKYCISPGKYVRHPEEYKYTFSRDQAVCLLAGLLAQGRTSYVDPDYKTEGDVVTPAIRGHFRRCAGKFGTWLGDKWLIVDIYFNAKIAPMNEPNQLICVLMTHTDEKYLKMWTDLNKKWKESITEYWCGWRGEPELADLMIKTILYKIKK